MSAVLVTCCRRGETSPLEMAVACPAEFALITLDLGMLVWNKVAVDLRPDFVRLLEKASLMRFYCCFGTVQVVAKNFWRAQ